MPNSWTGNTQQERKNLSDFAEYLEVSQPTISTWLNGKKVPNNVEVIQSLATKLGSDVFNYVGRDTDPLLQYIIANWDYLPPDKQLEFKTMIDEATRAGSDIANNRKSTLRRT